MKYGLIQHYDTPDIRIVRLDPLYQYKVYPDGMLEGAVDTDTGMLNPRGWIKEYYDYDSGFRLCASGSLFELMNWCQFNRLGVYRLKRLSELV